MPSYISHAIMADQLHERLLEKDIKTDNQLIKKYSLLPDMASKQVPNHNIKTREYIIYIIKKIKNKDLSNNSEIMSLLYGIISHYYLDTFTHPFIYYLDYNTKPISSIKQHHLIEGYLDYYLAKEKLKKDILELKEKYCVSGKISKVCKNLIEESYKIIYCKEVMCDIKKNYRLIRLLELVYKRIVRNNELVSKIVSFDKYLKENNIKIEDLDNRNHNEWIHPFNDTKRNASFSDLYDEALDKSIETIELLEQYFKGNINLSEINEQFDKSYDTGTEIKMIKKLGK